MLGRAVAVGHVLGAAAGLRETDRLREVIGDRHRWHAVRGHLHELDGDLPAAASAYAEAARRATNVAERDHLVRQAARARAASLPSSPMTIQRMDHVGIIVDDLAAAIEFFVELGLEVQGQFSVEGPSVDRIVGLEGVRNDAAMLQTPDGNGRLELIQFHSPPAQGDDRHAPANTLGLRHLAFAVDDIEAAVAGLRARGAELVGELRALRGQLLALLRPRPGGDHRRAGREDRLTVAPRPARRTSVSAAAASTSTTGTTPSAAFSDVASASVPTVSGASSTANDVIATARPLASAARSGASATVTDMPIGNRLPSPIPSSDRPTSACAGAVDGHRTANPAAVTAEREREQPRRIVPARQPAAERAPDQHAAEVAGHQRDRGVRRHAGGVLDEGRAPGGDAPLGRGGAEEHRGRDPEHAGEPALRRRATAAARRSPSAGCSHHASAGTASEASSATRQPACSAAASDSTPISAT